MEGTLAPRGANAETAIGFHEFPGGGSLALGRPRYVVNVAVVGASLLVLAPLLLYVSSLAAANGNPGGALGIELSAILFGALGALMMAASILQSGRWLLSASEEGVYLQRTHRGPKAIPWSSVKRIQYGATVIQMGRYGARLGDAIRIDAHHTLTPISVDTVRFRVPADDMDRMAAVLKGLGGRHGVLVEPFPMAGRESH